MKINAKHTFEKRPKSATEPNWQLSQHLYFYIGLEFGKDIYLEISSQIHHFGYWYIAQAIISTFLEPTLCYLTINFAKSSTAICNKIETLLQNAKSCFSEIRKSCCENYTFFVTIYLLLLLLGTLTYVIENSTKCLS